MSRNPGSFILDVDPLSGERNRLVWCGPIDLAWIAMLRKRLGDVPAPFRLSEHREVSPREMFRAQLPYKPNVAGPIGLRHLRATADWLRPTTWPLLAAVHEGKAVDLYYAHFCVVPSQSTPTPTQLSCLVRGGCSWSDWCEAADTLGFLGIETNQGYEPFLIVFSGAFSRQLLDKPAVTPIEESPAWVMSFFRPDGNPTR